MRTQTDTPHDAGATGDDHSRRAGSTRRGRWFTAGIVIGWTVMAYGFWGIHHDSDGTNPPGLARWVLGVAIAHDAVLAPLAAIIGGVATWVLPNRIRRPILGAASLSAIAVLFSWPLVKAYGRHEFNSSTLPLDYTRNLGITLGLIWTTAIAVIVLRTVRVARDSSTNRWGRQE